MTSGHDDLRAPHGMPLSAQAWLADALNGCRETCDLCGDSAPYRDALRAVLEEITDPDDGCVTGMVSARELLRLMVRHVSQQPSYGTEP